MTSSKNPYINNIKQGGKTAINRPNKPAKNNDISNRMGPLAP
jgi:hypothetical protein